MAGRIDVHHHIIPPNYAARLRRGGLEPGGVPVPNWTADKSLKVMDRNNIDTAILSVSTPGVWFGDHAEARTLAREVNEYAAGVVADRPTRFGFFATLTLPDVQGAIKEADYALDQLGADGIVLITNAHGTYVYEEEFAPLLAHLHDRKAVVFLHPGELEAAPAPGIPSFTADFLLDTVRAATGLILSGSLERYPDIRWILSHAGGFLPYISHRVLLTMLREESKLSQAKIILRQKTELPKRLDLIKRFYFDVALSSTPAALPTLLAVADTTRVLYGSDFPFAPSPAVRFMAKQYDGYPLRRQLRRQIDRTNAEALFPRLAR